MTVGRSFSWAKNSQGDPGSLPFFPSLTCCHSGLTDVTKTMSSFSTHVPAFKESEGACVCVAQSLKKPVVLPLNFSV